MELFKNSVGRPSNEIKKKRRNFVIAIVLVCVIAIGGLSYLVINNFSNKENKSNKLKGEVYINPYIKMQHFREYNYYNLDDKYVGKGLILIKNKNDEVSSAFFPKGDVDFDGRITENDARLALKVPARLDRELNDLQLLNADLNGDGKITAGEARKILKQSKNKNGFQNYKVCVIKHRQDEKKCNWKNLSSNGWNTKIIENNVKYDIYVYNISNGNMLGYTDGVVFNGTNKTKTDSKVDIWFTDSKKTTVDVGETIQITAKTNDMKLKSVWVDDSTLGWKEWDDTAPKTSDYNRTYTFHAKKAGVAKIYVESSEGAVNSIDIKISKKYVDVINYSGKLSFGGTYDFPIKTNAGKITNINCDGGNCVDKGIVRITGTNGKYTLRVIGVGKTTVNVKTSGGAKASVKIETQATYDDPVSKVFGSKNYYITKIGGIETYVDNACKNQSKYKAILNKLPKYALKSVNRVNIVNDAQFNKYGNKDWAAVTSGGAGTGYGTSITFRCSYASEAPTVTHEFGHAVEMTYRIYTGQDLIAYFDKNDSNYKKSKNKKLVNNILRDYSRTSRDEFFADSYSGYILKANFRYSDKQLASIGRRMMYSTKGIGMNLYGYTESAIKLARKVIENK